MKTRRSGGDPVESDRLRPLFLAWVGRRSNSAGFAAAEIPATHGASWVAGTTILADIYQARVRRLLDEAGVAPSPCG